MKWLLVCLAVFFMVAPAFAGEDPFIAIVGKDCVTGDKNPLNVDDAGVQVACSAGAANSFYFSPKHRQFMYDELADPFDIPEAFDNVPDSVTRFVRFPTSGIHAGQEQFRANTALNQVEVCQTLTRTKGVKSAKVIAGNGGFFEWYIRVPKKPIAINVVLECGVIKPNGVAAFPVPQAIELCAAETGEVLGFGICSPGNILAGESPIIEDALPQLEVIAYPGPYAFTDWKPFHLTAFKNPGSYVLFSDDFPAPDISPDNPNVQVLDGTTNSRVLLKACMDKTVLTKLPVDGQINGAGETEADLEAGDLIKVKLTIPGSNNVDIYCNAQSAFLAGIGHTP